MIESMTETYSVINASIRNFDVSFARYMIEARTPIGNTFFFIITHFADILVVLFVILLSAIIFKASGYGKNIIPMAVCVAGSAISSELLKLVFERERPANPVYFEPTFSFPSTHAAISLALYGFIAFLLIEHMKNRALSVTLSVLFVATAFAVAFSRVYLGVHYLSDVAGGLVIALFWLVVSAGIHKVMVSKNTPKIS